MTEPVAPSPLLLAATWWYKSRATHATEVEVLVLAVMLTLYLDTAEALDKWLELAATDATRMSQLGDQWAPLPDSIVYNSGGKVLEPLESALHAQVMTVGGDGGSRPDGHGRLAEGKRAF